MMNLKEIREAYEELSRKLSDVNRQLCFAGIALIWIFNATKNSISLPKDLYLPMFLLVISLGLDIVQYFISTIFWYGYYLRKKSHEFEDEKVKVQEPEWLNVLPWTVLIVKFFVLFAAYILIGRFISHFL